jgi:hypothetical protein
MIGTAVATVYFRRIADSAGNGPTATGGDGNVYRVAWVGEDRYVHASRARTVQVRDTAGGRTVVPYLRRGSVREREMWMNQWTTGG